MATPVKECRICGNTRLEDVLSLGDMPPVNSFLSGAKDIAAEKKHPLALVFCDKCTHVQLTHMIDPKDIFEDYIYFSSMSETIVRHGEALAARYLKEIGLNKDDLVGELASNDGCILRPFRKHSRVYGVEPAKNIAEVANKDGIPTLADFFDSKTAKAVRAEQGAAKLIIARNVVAHVPEVVDFISGVATWLSDDGILHVEAPYLGEMIDKLEFDTIYHEHLSYFSVIALSHLFERAGLILWDVELIGLHGGSLIARGKKPHHKPTENVARFIAEEKAKGLDSMTPLKRFADGTHRLKTQIPDFLSSLKKENHTLAAYGAAAKGVVLTNYCNIGTDLFSWIADRSPYKQGKLTPGMHIPVVAPERIAQEKPSHVVVLAWNFLDEIRKQQNAHAKAGGKFIVPVPEPRVV